MSSSAPRTVVIGLGNPCRGDDAAGAHCVELLRGRVPSQVELLRCREPAALLEPLARAHSAYLIDACRSGAAPGTVQRFDVCAHSLPALPGALSTHGLELPEALELARVLGALPMHCVLYAIEGQSYTAGAPLSAPVRRAVAAVAADILGAH